jgi:hypothetical protein
MTANDPTQTVCQVSGVVKASGFLLGIVAVSSLSACVGYFSDDSVTVHSVNKRPSGGYERYADELTRPDAQFFEVSIGYKRLQKYGGDTQAAAEAESKRMTAERGYCPQGYRIQHPPTGARTGFYGYYWFLECNN